MKRSLFTNKRWNDKELLEKVEGRSMKTSKTSKEEKTKKQRTAKQKANAIVNIILGDLKGRRGLGNAWDDIDQEIQEEIADIWVKIAEEEIKDL